MSSVENAVVSEVRKLGLNDKTWTYNDLGQINVGQSLLRGGVHGSLAISGFGLNVEWNPPADVIDVDSYYNDLNSLYVGCVVPFNYIYEIHAKNGGVTPDDLDFLIQNGSAKTLFGMKPLTFPNNGQNTIIIKKRGAGVTPDCLRLNLRNRHGVRDVEPIITESLVSAKIGSEIVLKPLLRHGEPPIAYIVPEADRLIAGWANMIEIAGVMPINEQSGIARMKSYGGVDQARIGLSLGKDSHGDVLEVTARGLNSGLTSTNFGVTSQGLFYPGVAVQIVPREIGSKSELRKPGELQEHINDHSVFVVQWVGYEQNAKDIMVGEVLRYPDEKLTLHVLSGTDLGRYENAVLVHTPHVVPTRPNRASVNVWQRPTEDTVSSPDNQANSVTVLQASVARMLVLAQEWKVQPKAINTEAIVVEHFVE